MWSAARSACAAASGCAPVASRRKPLFSGLDLSEVTDLGNPAATWEFVDRLKDATSMRLVVKGIVTRVPVIVDGGFRRGTDMVKALALGASAVGIGRPYLWGLGAFGEAGVDAVLLMLRAEPERSMQLIGATSLRELDGRFIAG